MKQDGRSIINTRWTSTFQRI